MSEPVEASIFLNGQLVGYTLRSIQNVKSGEYQILLQKEGYADYSTTITIES